MRKLVVVIVIIGLVSLMNVTIKAEHCDPFTASGWTFRSSRSRHQVHFQVCQPASDRYRWYFGDGTSQYTYQNEITHYYSSPGVYEVRLEGRDVYGNWRKVVQHIKIPAQTTEVSMKIGLSQLSAKQRSLVAIGLITSILVLLSD